MSRTKIAAKKLEKTAKEHNIVLLRGYKGSTKLVKFKSLSCGHTFEMLPFSFYRNVNSGKGFSCPVCHENDKKLTVPDIRKYISEFTQKEYKLKSAKGYKNSRDSKLEVFHKTCGNSFPITFSNFQLGRRCPYCAAKTTESKAAQLLKKVLEHLKISFETEKEFENLKNPFTGKGLRYDLYIPDLDLLIEIDGEQHFIPIERFGGEKALRQTRYRDYLKDKYALKTRRKLYRIPLYENGKKRRYEEVKKHIFNLVHEIALNIKAKNS